MMKWLNKKGQTSFSSLIAAMAGALGALIFMYAWLVMWDPITQELLFPTLDNVTYGSIIQTLFLLIPLIIAIAIIVSVIGVGLGTTPPRERYPVSPPY